MRPLFVALLLFVSLIADDTPPPDFVDLHTLIPSLQIEARYAGSENFVGRPVDGYEAPRCYLTRPAAEALRQVQEALRPFGLGLKVFDAYRPQRAVDHFVRWAKDLNDTKMKASYYPRVSKSVLFKEGYIAARSGHSRGSTVDLTIIDLADGNALDMGTGFDFFGPESWPENTAMTVQQRANRMLLRSVMTRYGFRPLQEEWWHFTLENEPYPDRYFDFPVH